VTALDSVGDVIETSKRDHLNADEVMAHIYHFVMMFATLDKGLPYEYPGSNLPAQIIVFRETDTISEEINEP
jgi:hypothetical protein